MSATCLPRQTIPPNSAGLHVTTREMSTSQAEPSTYQDLTDWRKTERSVGEWPSTCRMNLCKWRIVL